VAPVPQARIRDRARQLPFKWYPKGEFLAHAGAWRLLDLSESNGRPIDLLVATKFPTYFARHPRKVTWLVHQHRAAYELVGTPYSDFDHDEHDLALRESLIALDTAMLGRVSRHLQHLGHDLRAPAAIQRPRFTPLYHPPRLADRLRRARRRYVLSLGRLRRQTRGPGDSAMAHTRRRSAEVAGTGSRARVLERSPSRSARARVQFLERSTTISHRVFSGALASSSRPTTRTTATSRSKPCCRTAGRNTTDAGGPNEFVTDGETRSCLAPMARRLARRSRTRSRQTACRAVGGSRLDLGAGITWSGVIERLSSAGVMTKLIIQIPCLNEADHCRPRSPLCPARPWHRRASSISSSTTARAMATSAVASAHGVHTCPVPPAKGSGRGVHGRHRCRAQDSARITS
jgi:hypothetical protein